jgi:hypothetical protein
MIEKNKVDLINRCLLAIGEAPVENDIVLDTIPLGTDVYVASRMVDKTITEVLNRGWYFNTDYDFSLVPDDEGFITLPPNVLRVDFGATEFKHQYVMRNGRIYDMVKHTFVIDKKLTADVIYEVEIEELPVSAYEYIGARAARKFQEKVIGDLNMTQITLAEETEALASLQREQLQYQDYGLIRGSRITNAGLKYGLYLARGRR